MNPHTSEGLESPESKDMLSTLIGIYKLCVCVSVTAWHPVQGARTPLG